MARDSKTVYCPVDPGEVPIFHMSLIPRSLQRVLIAGAAVLVLGGAAVGIAAAQTAPAATPSGQQAGYQKFIDALAKRLNISSATLETAIGQARSDAGLPGNGQGFPGGRGPVGGAVRGGPGGFFGIDFNTAATFLGVTPQQLRSELPRQVIGPARDRRPARTRPISTPRSKTRPTLRSPRQSPPAS